MINKINLYYKIKQMRSQIIAPVDIMGCYSIPKIVQDEGKKLYVLISLMISSQTKDEINFQSMLNLISSRHKQITNNNQIRYKNTFNNNQINEDTFNNNQINEDTFNNNQINEDTFNNNLEVEINGNKYLIERIIDWDSIIEKHITNYSFSLRNLLEMTSDEINKCISKVGFHNRKSELIKNLCEHLSREGFPTSLDECMKIKGIGLKMGLLYLNRFYKIQGISVDTHVHRIANRIGLVKTSKPEQTSSELEKLFDSVEFGVVNSVFVGFGQIICTAINPKCERCPVQKECDFGKNW